MRPAARLATFAAAVAVVAGGAAAAGGAIDPKGADEEAAPAHATHAGEEPVTSTTTPARDVRGLAVADEGLRVVVDDADLRPGARERLSFTIVDGHGEPVRDFEVEHERRMHL